MPDHNSPEALLIRQQEQERRASALKREVPPRASSPSPGLIEARRANLERLWELDTSRRQPSPQPNMLSARRLKVSVVLNPDELLAVPAPEGKSRAILRISLPDRRVSAEIAAKSLRKAQATVRVHGTENTACILQGNLVGDTIAEAGISAQPKTAKAPQA